MPYTVKLEGVEPAGFQRMFFFAVNDPTILENLDTWTANIDHDIETGVDEIAGPGPWTSARSTPTSTVRGRRRWGRGTRSGCSKGHEALVLVDVVAPDPETCEAVNDVVEYAYLHAKSPIWRGGATMAYPLQKRSYDLGDVYKFNVNHVVHVDDPLSCARSSWRR